MKNYNKSEMPTLEADTLTIYRTERGDNHMMGQRICDNCGHSKDTYGGKTCSKGHFICHSCASGHVHCPIDGHTLR